MTARRPQQAALLLAGVRSGLEEMVSANLKALGTPFCYEPFRIPFLQPQKPRHYTPDWLLLRNGILIEGKGRFLTADRQKHLLVKAQHPDLDIRFLFSRSAERISKQSQTTYAQWCVHKGFLYADKMIPAAWITEPPNRRALAYITRLTGIPT